MCVSVCVSPTKCNCIYNGGQKKHAHTTGSVAHTMYECVLDIM